VAGAVVSVRFANPDDLATLLQHAAASPRTVLEFRTQGEGSGATVTVLDITEHVEALEQREVDE
jgi:hypothetical protein